MFPPACVYEDPPRVNVVAPMSWLLQLLPALGQAVAGPLGSNETRSDHGVPTVRPGNELLMPLLTEVMTPESSQVIVAPLAGVPPKVASIDTPTIKALIFFIAESPLR